MKNTNHKGLSKAERLRFNLAREKLAKRIKIQIDALNSCTVLSAKDYSVRINCRD